MLIGEPRDLAAHANANHSVLTRGLKGLRCQPRHAVRLTRPDSWKKLPMGRTKTNNNNQTGRKIKNQKTNDEMKREVRNALGAIRELLSVSDAQEANAKYKVGRQVLAVQAKYGKRAVKMLIEELRYGKDVLYNAAREAASEQGGQGDVPELLPFREVVSGGATGGTRIPRA
jgi:hypothetical protein